MLFSVISPSSVVLNILIFSILKFLPQRKRSANAAKRTNKQGLRYKTINYFCFSQCPHFPLWCKISLIFSFSKLNFFYHREHRALALHRGQIKKGLRYETTDTFCFSPCPLFPLWCKNFLSL